MACGIIKLRDILIRADKVVYVYEDEDDKNGKTLMVGVGEEQDLSVDDCSLERFYDEWRKALAY